MFPSGAWGRGFSFGDALAPVFRLGTSIVARGCDAQYRTWFRQRALDYHNSSHAYASRVVQPVIRSGVFGHLPRLKYVWRLGSLPGCQPGRLS